MMSMRLPEQHDENLELMTMNLLQIKKQITQRDEQQFQDNDLSYRNREILETYKINQNNLIGSIKEIYSLYLKNHKFPKNHQEKLNKLVSQPLSVGSSIALFQMLFYFRSAISEQIISSISRKAFQSFINTKSQAQMRCFAELMAECGVCDEQVCQYFAEALLDQRLEFEICFLVLSNLGTVGLAYLINLANKQIGELTIRILDNLSRSQSIIQQIIIPNLLNDTEQSNNPKQKDIALAALNRLNSLNNSSNTLHRLSQLMEDQSIDKKLLIATIRSSGSQGEQLLLNMLKSKNYSEPINLLILSVLSWRTRSKPNLRIKSIQYNLEGCFLPGKLYQYEGRIEAVGFQSEESYDSLCLNSRDFLTHLHRFIMEKANSLQGMQDYRVEQTNNRQSFYLTEVLEFEDQQTCKISTDVVKMLINELSSKSIKIRQTALIELGNIGLPEAYESLEKVSKCLWESDSNIRSNACWVISRISENLSKKIINRLVELLKDNFWKVRTAACITIGLKVRQPLHNVVEGLLKVLNDGSIKKITVCESIIKLGNFGEQILLQILKSSNKNDFKIKQAIIGSFQFISIESPVFNMVVQEIFKHCKDTRVQTRILCLNVLNILKNRIQQEGSQITYFKAKNILPFYYYFLDDPVAKIRSIAAQNILAFGSQAELIFIEGMTRGQVQAKIECIKCLGKLGVQNFRAIILGFRDEDQRVKKATIDTILQNFQSKQIVEYFQSKENHSISLLCNLKDILAGQINNIQAKKMIKQIIYGLQKTKQKGFISVNDENFMIN